MKADYRVTAIRCSSVLQAASKALGKSPPCFAGPVVVVPRWLISASAACVPGKPGDSHREERGRHFRKGLVWVRLRYCGKQQNKAKPCSGLL